MNKKGIFFSFLCFFLLLLLILIFTSPRHLMLFYRQPIQEQHAYTLNALYASFDAVLIPDILRIASIQALLVATEKVSEKGYFSLTEKTGSITTFEKIVQGNEFAPEMKEKHLRYWVQKYAELAKQEYHADLTILFSDIFLTQKSPWKVNIHATAEMTLTDTRNKMQWSKKNVFLIEIPLIGLPDPLWAGQGIRVLINDTLSNGMKTDQVVWKGNKDKSALLQAAMQQHAFFHPAFPAPHYLSRFEGGKITDATTGIFALADYTLQKKQQSPAPGSLRRSYLDYRFMQPIQQAAELSYITGISDIDGLQEDYVPNRIPPVVYQEFHIFGMSGRKKTADGFRFKLEKAERAYFGFEQQDDGCKDDVDDNKPAELPIFPTDNKECYQLAQKLASSQKAVIGSG